MHQHHLHGEGALIVPFFQKKLIKYNEISFTKPYSLVSNHEDYIYTALPFGNAKQHGVLKYHQRASHTG